MVTLESLGALVLALPGTEATRSWESPSFKVNGKVILYWNTRLDAPVFKVPFEERDFLIAADPDTFFTTDHHRPHALILARPDRLDPGWAEATILRTWRELAKKRTVRDWDARQG